MAIREIRVLGDDVLTKHCKEVTKMSIRTKILIEDMLDTMYEAMGVGLAAPQVGVLKRIVVIDVGDGPIILINPEILETSGEQTGEEGCLSLPGKAGTVTRPNYAKVKALNEDMEEVILADRIIVMDQGKIVMDGKPKEIFSRVDEMKTLGLVYSDNAKSAIKDIEEWYSDLEKEKVNNNCYLIGQLNGI